MGGKIPIIGLDLGESSNNYKITAGEIMSGKK